MASRSGFGPLRLDPFNERRSLALSYGLWCLSLVGVCGVHRLYNRKPLSGIFWLLTFGFFGIGQLIDLFLIPRMVEEANQALLLQQAQVQLDLPILPSLEKQLLQLARQKTPGGFTLNDALLEVDLLPGQSSGSITKEIQRLQEADLLHVGNDERGRVVYREP
ncbi:MAG: TM2 domain-containing protein [Cyanobacteria bacterium]|nr:TM2 domain-containing protein [Cyanobacteriota bacterium]